MKKIIFIMLLAMAANGGFAQSGGIIIDNKNQTCGVYIFMSAEAPGSGIPTCSIQSNTIYLAPGTSVSYLSHGAFTGAVGWLGTIFPPSTAPDFAWNEAGFQFDCFGASGCSNGGTWINGNGSGLSLVNTCSSAQNPVASSAGGCVGPITWSPDPENVMDDVVITFN